MKTVLIVDDDHANRILMRHILENTGCQIVEAENGQDALEMVLEYNPDLIILDILMPIMNGWQVAETLKSSSETAHVPIIGLSSEASEDHQKAIQI